MQDHNSQSTAESEALSDDVTVDNERLFLRTLLERVGLRAAAEVHIEQQHAAEIRAEQEQYQIVFQQLTESYEAEQATLEHKFTMAVTDCETRCQQSCAAVQAAYRDDLAETDSRFARENDDATKIRDDAVWMVSSLLDDESENSPIVRLQQARMAFDTADQELATGLKCLDAAYEQVERFLRRTHCWSDPPDAEPRVRVSSAENMKNGCLDAIRASEPLRQRIVGRILPRLFMNVVPYVVFAALGLLLFSLVWVLVNPRWIGVPLEGQERDWIWISAGIAAAFSFSFVFMLNFVAAHRVWPDFEELHQLRTDATYAHSVWEKTCRTELNILEAECTHLQMQRVQKRESAIAAAESKLQGRLAEIQQAHVEALSQLHFTYPARINLLEQLRGEERAQIEAQYRKDLEALLFRRETDFRNLQSEFDARTADSRRRYQLAWRDLIQAWQFDLTRFGHFSDSCVAQATAICPHWESLLEEQRELPRHSPPFLTFGQIGIKLSAIEQGVSLDQRLAAQRESFDLPLLLPLHERPSLILKTTGPGRDQAVQTLQSTMLRFLTSLPPGKVRFTIFDPVGLGASFAAFMHLADYDELLVSSRIWTEPSHIEKRLADLTEHMETVLQTYLRNEFATIDDYNEFAGEVAEPYRVLVIANFPVNFTETSLRRLLSIADGGRRCGVFLLMSFDTSQELPRGFHPADLEKYATVIQTTKEGFRLQDTELSRWPLLLEAPPVADRFGQIVRQAGQQARDAHRVEVPFERVAPSEDQFWQSDSRNGIDVPIGRAGATKLQNMRLGKGTSQHVLIAGKTGSGKSTLLHALITNLSLYYSPAEVEFYLIDFKKGVEFKVYAEQQLPHARVIAIESDREFGVSVLERLDDLLRDRGELFREAGVQDIAGYRNARPDEVMPRTLLLVDEFQEFFVEDDAISQKASLLLDRLIRQGRAFGVHILLGSQTLAGAYSLARSTLGQVAVRIALQCSETDAHLILSEENTAARLLTRPGEAIYNDANGLIEGNHPFQVVWLGEETRAGYLQLVREQVAESGSHGLSTPAIRQAAKPALVFEGNLPADPTANRALKRLLARGLTAPHSSSESAATVTFESPWTCWLGDSVSLSGPLELNFGIREGGHVLVVGRNEEAALGVLSTSAMALGTAANASGIGSTSLFVLDGSLPNSASAQLWRQIDELFSNAPTESEAASRATKTPPTIVVGGPRDTIRVLNDVAAELHRRTDEPGPPVFLFVFDLARFRDLRKSDDDFGYRSPFGGGGEEKPASVQDLWNEILRDGPAAGIFTVAWADSFQTCQRFLSREQLNRFEQRILFAMNGNDSSSLVDSPIAGRLGENRALLYRGDLGTLEKFRPYSPPPTGWLKRLTAALSAQRAKSATSNSAAMESPLTDEIDAAPADTTQATPDDSPETVEPEQSLES